MRVGDVDDLGAGTKVRAVRHEIVANLGSELDRALQGNMVIGRMRQNHDHGTGSHDDAVSEA